jgi:hypothetical protein
MGTYVTVGWYLLEKPNLNIIQIKKSSLENSKEVLIKLFIQNIIGYMELFYG